MKNSIYLAAVLVLLTSGHALAVPTQVAYTGHLVEQGTPVTGTKAMTFSIFDASTGGNKLWNESFTSVQVDSGIFSVNLGAGAPLNSTVFDGATRYLEIAIGSQTLSPRVAIVSTPYAITAGNVTGNIAPNSISVGGQTIIDSTGKWVGSSTGLVGPELPG